MSKEAARTSRCDWHNRLPHCVYHGTTSDFVIAGDGLRHNSNVTTDSDNSEIGAVGIFRDYSCRLSPALYRRCVVTMHMFALRNTNAIITKSFIGGAEVNPAEHRLTSGNLYPIDYTRNKGTTRFENPYPC